MVDGQLVVHAGGWNATLDEIANIPKPQKTWSYTPIPHEAFIQAVKDMLPSRGLQIKQERYALANKGQRMFGVMDLIGGVNQPDWSLAVGLRNSYDKMFRLQLVGGHRVLVCDNLAFYGEIILKMLHRGSADKDMRANVGGLIDSFRVSAVDIEKMVEGMKNFTISDSSAHDFVCRSIIRGILPTSHASDVLEQYHNPTHEDFKPRTAWSLFNAYTNVAKQRTPALQIAGTIALSDMMRESIN